MKEALLGPILLLGGIGWAALYVWEWLRWRAGRPAPLPWLGFGRKGIETPRTEMNRIVEAAGTIGNVLLGVVVAMLGLAFILEY